VPRRICEQLKQEIQRILKSAKDVQNMYGGSRWPGASELLALLGGGPPPELGTQTGGEQQEVVAVGHAFCLFQCVHRLKQEAM
jgi:hypothetical protein